MDGKDKSLLRLMDGSDNRFIIPVYQRNYDWGQSQCKQLYDDLIDIALNNRAAPLPEIPSDFSEREGDTTYNARGSAP